MEIRYNKNRKVNIKMLAKMWQVLIKYAFKIQKFPDIYSHV